MNKVLNALKERRSIRKFKPEMISEDELNEILEAGLYAASGMGKQSTKIIAITNKKLRDDISEENRKIGGFPEGKDPFYGAPVILLVIADKSVSTHVYDGSLVMGNLMNAAYSLGVGSIWIHRAKEEIDSEFGKQLLADLHIDGDWEGIGHCALGYADGVIQEAAARKPDRIYLMK